MFQTKLVEKIKTVFINPFFFFENLTVYEITWKNIVERGGLQMTIWRMRIHAGYLRLQMHELRLCNIHCFSTATMVARTFLNVTLYLLSIGDLLKA